jgi:hypothetical protein
MSSSFRALISVFPNFPSGGGMPVGGQFQETFFQESSSNQFPEIDPSILRPEETTSDKNHDRVLRALISEGWHPIESPQRGEIVDVVTGNENGYRTFTEALIDNIGRPVELKLVMDAAKAHGWDGQSWTDV